MSRQEELEKQLTLWQRRLKKRKEQKAILGISADPSIDIEIENIEATIEKLREEQVELRLAPAYTSTTATPLEVSPASLPVAPNPKLAAARAQPRIFLCHASEDKDRVKDLYHQLKQAGYFPWLDKEDLLPGQSWRREIRKIITNPYNLVVICLSQKSITKRGVVQQEIKWALDVLDQMPEDTIYLIPARLELCSLPDRLSDLHWVDLFDTDGFKYLTRALDHEIGQRQQVPKTAHPKIITPTQPYEPATVLIGAGSFWMGSQLAEGVSDDESPQHQVVLSDYRIGLYPVTNEQYQEFIDQTGTPVSPKLGWDLAREGQVPPKNKLKHPVVGVSWDEAMAYCRWLSEQTGLRYRLPTEAEWEKAARGADNKRIYPWGNAWDAQRCNCNGEYPTPVDMYKPQTPYQCYDMAGNVWEWTSTMWGNDPTKPTYKYPYEPDDRESLEPSHRLHREYRICRGGSYRDDQTLLRCSARAWYPADSQHKRRGFRVVLEAGSN